MVAGDGKKSEILGGPAEGGPDVGRWLGLQPGVRRISDAVPSSSLYSHSQRSCRPQPRGGGGDATSRKDTRQDCWLYFDFPLRRVLRSYSGEGPKCRESLARRAGNSAEMTVFTCEEILDSVNGIKGQRPKNRTRSAFFFSRLRDCLEVLVSSHVVPSLVSGRGSTVSKRTCRTLPTRIGLPFTTSVERFVLQLLFCFRYLQTFTRRVVDKVSGWT